MIKRIGTILLLLTVCVSYAQKYPYVTVTGDPLKTRIYTLKNGLKVFMSVYKEEPRIHTVIAVKAGSKHDPRETTGLAHYFEHLMFKGTSSFGTNNWPAEKMYVQQIDSLFEIYRFTKDTTQRKALYHYIDSISYIASKLAIPNEYFKLLAMIGGKGTNAATSYDQTVYINNIPANQLENWMYIESNRFSDPVLRLFHTELETIYEEKNMTMTNDGRKASNALMEAMFPSHPYGTTIIGESDHIKNPSLKNIREFYQHYYVPNNMAICLSGDLDPDKTIALLDFYFGKMKPGNVPAFTFTPEKPIESVISKEVMGPDAEKYMLAYRIAGANSLDADMLSLIDLILNNSAAGLIDLNLNNKQKVLNAASYQLKMKDYSFQLLQGSPKQGQTLDDVKVLLLAQIDSVRKGAFPDWLVPAIINNMKLDEIKGYESNQMRVQTMVDAFINETSWSSRVSMYERLSKITKQDIVKFATENFKDNYVEVYKRTGEDKTLDKIAKPPITPIVINRDMRSVFLDSVAKRKSEPIQPQFVNFEKDIQTVTLKNKTEVYFTSNKENDLFELYFVVDMGTSNNKKISTALSYLNYLGTKEYSNERLSQEFYKLACSFSTSYTTDKLHISLSGLHANFEPALKLLITLLKEPIADTSALSNLKSDILKKRIDAKKNPATINQALISYGIYGAQSPFTYNLSNDEVNALSAEELINEIKAITETTHRILYYGPLTAKELAISLNAHDNTMLLKPVANAVEFKEQTITEASNYLVNFDIKQATLVILSNGVKSYDPTLIPVVTLFNKYFGAGAGSIVFQEIREARSMAYTARSNYQTPTKKELSFYNVSSIGTQHDKLCNAQEAMIGLLDSLPLSEKSFTNAKEAILQTMPSERITRSSVLFAFENAKKLGLDYDIRKDIYTKVKSLTIQDLSQFHSNYIRNKPRLSLILGNTSQMDKTCIERYGPIRSISLQEIFGY